MLATVSRALSLIGLVAAPLAAEVVRIEVHSRADVVNYRPSAPPAPVDPTLPAHPILTDIDTPWNANGRSNFEHVNIVHCEWRPNLEV